MKYLLLVSIFVFSACNEFLDVSSSPDMIQSGDIYTSEESVLSASNGVYVQMRNSNTGFANGGMSIYLGLYADELINPAQTTSYANFFNNSLTVDNTVVNSTFWTEPYSLIYRVNAILEGISASALNSEFKNQITGEMLVVRSFLYSYLVNLFGDVPLIISTDYEINQYLARTSMDQISGQITKDLEKAIEILDDGYPSSGKVRPNKDVARALLARIYLEKNMFERAADLATTLIGSGRFPLLSDDLSNAFLINGQETIWEIASKNESTNAAEGIAFIPARSTVVPTFVLTDNVLDNFNNNDLRKRDWIGKNTVGESTYYYPYKYKNRSTTPPVTEYNIVFRIPEQYLIAADAYFHLEEKDNCLHYLNLLRKRADQVALDGSISFAALSDELRREWQREYFAEWGTRWLDLKRSGLLERELSHHKLNWQSTDAFFPIPFKQININVNLSQNDGY